LHNLNHLLSDSPLVGVLCVTGCFNLLSGLFGESQTEKSEGVAISGFALDECLNKRMPFFYHGACFVSGDIHTIKVGVTLGILDFVDLELELSPGLCLRLVVAVSQGDIKNTTS
jgi:hypothetical protein